MENKLKKGRYVRINGNVTIYSPYKKQDGKWIGGSTWAIKNPLIRLGKCKHKPKKVIWIKERDLLTKPTGKRIYFTGRVICSDCGYIIKLGKEIKKGVNDAKM